MKLMDLMTSDMKRPKTYHKDRFCKFPWCTKTLNIYNSDIYCHHHQKVVWAIDAVYDRCTLRSKKCKICRDREEIGGVKVSLGAIKLHPFCLKKYLRKEEERYE